MALAFNPKFKVGGNPRDGFKIELKGVKDLTRKLENSIRRMQQAPLRRACQAFAEPIRADTERRARAEISPRVQIKTEIKLRDTTANVKIGPIGEFFYMFFFEYGWHARQTLKGPKLKYTGATPMMRPAYDAHKEEGLKAMEQIMFDEFADGAS